MLSELVKEAFSPREQSIQKGISGSLIRPCDYANYITYHKLDLESERDWHGQIVMEDGQWQEKKVIAHLRRAGIKVKNVTPQQMTLHVGKARTIGHLDGIVEVERERALEIKSMSNMRFHRFAIEGVLEDSIKCQTQAYLFSDELYNRTDEMVVYATCKETSEPFDRVYGRDESFIKPIIEGIDAIVLEGYEPKRAECDYCIKCSHQVFCWGALVRDMTKPRIIPLQEAVDGWTKGKALKMSGEELIDLYKPVIEKELGDEKKTIMEGTDYQLKVQRIDRHAEQFNQAKFIKEFGIEALKKVMDAKDSSFVRIDLL